ncbi:MAG: hypothetical protein O2822_01900, partial [Chloroflexi bacterium]|nr:hypothetical protein [Chloroflexota bacterium]
MGPLLDDVTADELDAILARRIEPRLQAGRWGDALADGAQGLGEAYAGTLPSSAGGEASSEDGGGSGSGALTQVLLPVGLVLLGGFFVVRALARRKQRGTDGADAAPTPLREVGDLSREANALLVETDEDVRQNEQELGFAEAQFGAAEAEPFRSALGEARGALHRAFTLRQQLDDAEPESEADQRTMLQEMITLCGSAQEIMDDQQEHFQRLRDLEREAPRLLDGLPDAVQSVEQRIPNAERQLATVIAEAPGSGKAIAGNISEAHKRLVAANELIAGGRAAYEQDDRPGTARSVRAAQDLIAQGGSLLDAIAQLDAQLTEARDRAPALRADVASDIATAERMLDEHPDAAVRTRLSALRAALDAAGATSLDVIAEYRRLQEADTTANDIVAASSAGVERRQREDAALRLALRTAEMRIER